MNSIKVSQNFIYKESLAKYVVNICHLTKYDDVYEIGPGKGVLTKEIAKMCNHLVAIELDHALATHLKSIMKPYTNVLIIESDILDYSLPNTHAFKIVSNIPFNISASIIDLITNRDHSPSDSFIVVQEEVAYKYAGSPYGNETLKSMLLKPHFEMSIVHTFSKSDFIPSPNINAVLLHIMMREYPLIPDILFEEYCDFMAYSFSRMNMSIKSAFRDLLSYEQLKRLSREYGFDMNTRPGCLLGSQWIALFNFFSHSVPFSKRISVHGVYSSLLLQQSKLVKRHRNVNPST
jgi:23S rRNA (adenine-N6)-dimethyltransferase